MAEAGHTGCYGCSSFDWPRAHVVRGDLEGDDVLVGRGGRDSRAVYVLVDARGAHDAHDASDGHDCRDFHVFCDPGDVHDALGSRDDLDACYVDGALDFCFCSCSVTSLAVKTES